MSAGLVLALLGLVTAVAQPDAAPLTRHRPILRYGADEEYRAQPVSLPAGIAERRAGDRVYGHVAQEGGETWLQYWLFYAYNSQDRGIVATGRHEGDWELVQVRVSEHGAPVEAVLAQHSWAERCAWNELETEDDAAILYVANGSHALYATPGTHDRPWPDPNDEAHGDGGEVRPPVTVINNGHPAWVDYSGRWGDSEAGWVPGEQSSPRGPRFTDRDVWAHPAAFADAARECGSGAPGRPWQLPVELALIGLVGAVLALRVRNERANRVESTHTGEQTPQSGVRNPAPENMD
jgi:hypothetical protein